MLLVLLFLAEVSYGAKPQFLEIVTDIEVASRRSDQTNGEASTKPRLMSVDCVTDGNIWQIECRSAQGGINRWFYDGTNVFESIQVTQPLPPEREELIRATSGLAIVPFERARSNLTIYI